MADRLYLSSMFKIAWSPIYHHPLPEGHKFPMEKYSLLPEQLIYEGTIGESSLFAPDSVSEEDLLRVHDSEYWKRLLNLQLTPSEQRRSGFPHSEQLIERERCIMQGTLQAALFALKYGAAANIAGGTHHAYSNRAEGFCLLNDMAIAARYLIHHRLAKRVLFVDLDVHQGNGSAEIFRDDPAVFTFSMHGRDNYPMHKEKSDLDVELPKGTSDEAYLKLLRHHLPRIVDNFKPDFVFYQCGVDVLASDKLGHLGLTIQGCRERDSEVISTCHKNSLPLALSMGGGYSKRIADIIEAHANTYRLVAEEYF